MSCPYLYFIKFQNHWKQELYSNQLKIAKVVPMFKSVDKLSPDNFRPNSVLPNFSKILEKVVSNRLIGFLGDQNLISEH